MAKRKKSKPVKNKKKIVVEEEEQKVEKDNDYLYFAVQCKYRNLVRDQKGHMVRRVGWKDISTFLSLASTHRIMGYEQIGGRFIDVGKPESVAIAEGMFI